MLREEKTLVLRRAVDLGAGAGPSPFIVRAPVQTDKTKESIIEINRELRGILKDRAVTADELATAQKDQTLKLPGQWETLSHISASIAQIVRFGLAG